MSEMVRNSQEFLPKEKFKDELQRILYTPISVENITNFTDIALDELLALNEAVIRQYQIDSDELTTHEGASLEDAAYAAYELEDIPVILDQITAVRDSIARLREAILEKINITDVVITPPDPPNKELAGTGNNTYEGPEKLNRLLTLAYILEHDFGIDQDDIEYTKGSTTDTMLRQEPYFRVLIEDLNRIVYICDEEGNASYVFNTDIQEQLGITPSDLDSLSKDKRNNLIKTVPAVGCRIIQNPQWRWQISAALQKEFDGTEAHEVDTPMLKSEFTERKKFLPYAEFETEVRRAYLEAGSPSGVDRWYRAEYKKRGWTSQPYVTYKNDGWKSYAELIGKEKIDFLPFTEFQAAVQAAYLEAGSPITIKEWYRSEYTKHKGWPSTPDSTYQDDGWRSYAELIGKEKIDFLPFTEFQAAVQAAYQKAGTPSGVAGWYRGGYTKHKGWPSQPHITYKNEGWNGYPELVGNETTEFLPFTKFRIAVQAVYLEAGSPSGTQKWYKSEYIKHKGWPSNPNDSYKDTGWKGYRELVKKEDS